MTDTPKTAPKAKPRASAEKPAKSAPKTGAALGQRLIDPAKRAGQALRASGQKLAEGNAEVGLKMLDLAEQNLQEAFTAMRAAARSKDLAGVMKVQAEFLRAQGERSAQQAKQIGEMIVQVGRNAVAPLRPGTTK